MYNYTANGEASHYWTKLYMSNDSFKYYHCWYIWQYDIVPYSIQWQASHGNGLVENAGCG
jgi:hypothetical protein